MAFFAVIREGLETVVFLLAVFQNADEPLTAGAGALLGIACAIAIGFAIYSGGVRINLARFFRITGFVLVLVAAGLVAATLHTAHEAGWLNAGQGKALDLTWLVVPGSWTSALLTGMLGWQPEPTYIELIGYLVFLIPAAAYILWPPRARLASVAQAGTAAALLLLLFLAGCGSSASNAGGSGAKRVEVKLTDAGCSPATLKLDAGRTTFKVINAGTGRVSELEVLDGSRILGEKENLVAGLSGSFTLSMQPGQYTLSCPGGTSSATGVLTVGGKAVAASTDPRLQAAVTGYRQYVHSQAVTLVSKVQSFVAAVKAGDVERAKSEFAAARVQSQTIEPVAESFGNLDPEIDARVNDVKPGRRWTGFHRIEHALWEKNSTAGISAIADKLLADSMMHRDIDVYAFLPARRARQRRERPARRGRLVEDHRRGGPLLAHRPVGLPRQRQRRADHVRAARAGAAREGPEARGRHLRPLRRRAEGARDAGRQWRVPELRQDRIY